MCFEIMFNKLIALLHKALFRDKAFTLIKQLVKFVVINLYALDSCTCRKLFFHFIELETQERRNMSLLNIKL